MKNHGMVCPPPQNQKEDKTLRDPTILPLPPFFEDFGGRFDVRCAQLRVVELTTTYGVGQRPYACLTISRERCTVCSQCAPLPSTLHPFSLMKKVSFGRFRPLRLILSRETMVPGPSSFF